MPKAKKKHPQKTGQRKRRKRSKKRHTHILGTNTIKRLLKNIDPDVHVSAEAVDELRRLFGAQAESVVQFTKHAKRKTVKKKDVKLLV
ncbi:MAG: histone-like protein [Candidatus Helarchaeota archaeon]